MKMSQGIGHEPSLQRLVIASVVLHFILMALFFIPFRTGEKEYKNYYVSLVEPSKVSGGGEVAARKAEEKPVAKKKALVNNKKIAEDKAIAEKKEQMALNVEKSRKAAIEKVEKDKAIRDAKNEVSKRIEERDKTSKIEGVRKEIEASAKGSGALGKGMQIASDSYYAEIIRKIEDEYVVPPNFDSTGVDVVLISINIDSKGNVVGFPTIEKKSGNDLFDQAALRAITKASPLPPPPSLVEMPIGLRFYP
jgi:colicin import membrane protein